jgi:uncharacterized repeat protein (TIGR01451 family)
MSLRTRLLTVLVSTVLFSMALPRDLQAVDLVFADVTKSAAGQLSKPAASSLYSSNIFTFFTTYTSARWYNGDAALVNALPNGIGFTAADARIFSDFTVPVADANGWEVSALLSNNLMNVPITTASYEIRTGVSNGIAGTLVFSGTAAATQVVTGRSLGGFTEYTVMVSGLNIHLAAGTYFLNVAPVNSAAPGTGVSYNTATTGTNAVGTPPGNNANEFWKTTGSNYAPTTGQGNDFSNGVIGNVTIPCVAPAITYVDDNWVGTPTGNDPDGAGPATYFGCDSFATIQNGVNGVTTGGQVTVAAGTYNEAQILILRSMSVTGAGASTTTINGLNTPISVAGLVRIVTPVGDAGNVTFSGFTVTNPGLSPETGGTHVTVYARPLNAASTTSVSNNHILGVNASDNGVYTIRNLGSVVYANNVFTNQAFNPIVIERSEGPTNVHHNTISSNGSTAYFNFTYFGTNVTSLQRVADNTIDGSTAAAIAFNSAYPAAPPHTGTFTNISIVNNTITKLAAGKVGVTLSNRAVSGSGPLGDIQNPVISGNIITGVDAVGSRGINVSGLVTNATITSNDVRNLERSFSGQISTDHSPTGTQAHFNNFVNNAGGFVWSGSETLNAENNWWGCNAGPGNTGCDSVTGPVDFDPWLVLGVTASPNPTTPGGTSTVTADMTHNSIAADTSGLGTVPLTAVAFTATEGTILPGAGTITAGLASSTFTSTSNNDGSGCATVDGQLVCTPIVIALSAFTIDDVTHEEGNAGTTSYTFTITRNGATTFNTSVDYATVNGTATAPSDFTAILTTNLIFLPEDTSKQITVLVNGDTTIEPTEAFTVHLSNPSGATITDADGTGTITNDDPCALFATVYVDDNWAGTLFGSDPDGAGPATSFGCDSFATIQEGVTAVTVGGTVIVNDGTYAEGNNAIHINKSLTVSGPNTLISPNGLAARSPEAVLTNQGTSINPNTVFSVDGSGLTVTVQGFKFDGTPSAMNAYSPNDVITLQKNIFIATHDPGMYFETPNLTINDNKFVDITLQTEDTIFLGRNVGEARAVVSITNNVWTNVSTGGANLEAITGTISGNTFQNVAYYGFLIVRDSGDLTISGNTFSNITNPDPTNVPTWGAGIRFYEPAVTSPVNVTGNTFINSYAGVSIRGVPNDEGANITGMPIHVNFNRFINNTFGISDGAAGTLDAENNWWGCNYGPGTGGAGCSGTPNGLGLNGSAIIDADPWIVLGVSASPNPAPAFGNSTVTADMTDNSAAADTSALGTVPLTPVTFSATQGTMAPPAATITAGQASSTFTSNSTSSGTACAMVDSQEVCTNITVVSPANVSGTKTKSGGNTPGSMVTYTVVLSNSGPTAQLDNPGNEFTDTLPASLTLVSANATSGTTSAAANTVAWNGSIPIGGSVTITITATINSGTTPQTISNQGTINYDADGNGTNESTRLTDDPAVEGSSNPTSFAVVSPGNVSGTKTKAGSSSPGGSLTYTVTLTNSSVNAQSDNPGNEFSDMLPSQLVLVSANATSGTATANVGTNTVSWNGSIAGNGSVTITITATINNVPDGTIVSNQGTINYDADGNGTNEASRVTDDPSVGGASDPTNFAVNSKSDLTITKSHSGNFSGGQVGATYTITVNNIGTGVTSGLVTVTDTVPVGLTPTGPNGAVGGWVCSINGQTLTCTRSDVLVGGASYPPISLTVNVANPAPLNVVNTATVAGGGEVNTANNTASDPTTINCSANFALNNTNPLMISRFRGNGPAGPQDEFVEIYNPSPLPHTVASGNCSGGGYGVYASAGNGTTSDAATLVCYIPNGTVIPAGGYYLCTGVTYSLNNLGLNGGPAGATATGDAPIGCGGTCGANIPDDAGLVLTNKAAPTVSSPEGFGLVEFGEVIYDKVGFGPYGPAAPAAGYPSQSVSYCEGGAAGCLKPVGDASTGAACTNPSGQFPVVSVPPACYGLAGQYEFLRRQTTFSATDGTIHQDTNNNGNDFILVAPNPVTNMGQTITGVAGVTAVLGAAGPYNRQAPPDMPAVKLTRTPFDGTDQLGPRNLERRFIPDPTIADLANNPLGTLTLRFKFTNNSGSPINAIRFSVDNLSTLCGPQTAAPTLASVATGDARNVGSTSGCGTGSFTAIFKALNSTSEIMVDGGGTAQFVNGTVMEDLSVGAAPGAGPLSPKGGGIDSTFIINPSSNTASVGDGVTGGVGNFATVISTTDPTKVIRVKVKFGVVRSGRFILLLVSMAKNSPAP